MNLMDPAFNGAARSEMYRAQLVPDLFPHEKRMLIENWPAEDREMYVGGEASYYEAPASAGADCGPLYVTHHEKLRMKGIE